MNNLFEPKNWYLVVVPDSIKVDTNTTWFNIQTSDTDQKAAIGRVVKVNGDLVKEGDKVIYHAYPAIKQVIGSDIYFLVKEVDIISVIINK